MENTAARHTDSADQRLTDLEIKSSFTEDTLEQLNQVVIRQQHEIEWLLREVKQLRQQIPRTVQRRVLLQPVTICPLIIESQTVFSGVWNRPKAAGRRN
jgi:SlyX protein